MLAEGVPFRSKNSSRKLLVDHRHMGRVFIILQRESSSRQEGGTGSTEIVRRDLVLECRGGDIRGLQIRCFILEDIHRPTAARNQGKFVGQRNVLYAGDR